MAIDQVEEVKSKIDIVDIISERINLKRAGRNFKAICPFHNEKTPSFMVSPELQIFKCFGCSLSGDVIKFLELYEKMSFWEAMEYLANRAGVRLIRKKMTQADRDKDKLFQLNSLVANFYHFLLTKHKLGKKALDYVKSRGINDKTIADFKLGFSPPGRDVVLGVIKKKGFTASQAVAAGIFFSSSRGGFSDRFYSRLVFPLFNHRGLVVGFSGRLVPGVSLMAGPKYTNSPETKIYHKGENLYGLWLNRQEIRKQGEAIVVEGEFDVISAFQAGIRNVVAIKGTSFTQDQARLIYRFAPTAVLALDSDTAGSEAIKRSGQIADKIGLSVKVVALPADVHDLDDLIKNKPKQVGKILSKKVPLWDFVLNLAADKYDLSTAEGKKGVLSESLPFLISIENEVEKMHYLKKLSDILSVDLDSILVEVGKVKSATQSLAQKFAPIESKSQLAEDRQKRLEKQLIMLLFFHKQWKKLADSAITDLIEDPLFTRLISQARKFFNKNKQMKVGDFFKSLPAELKSGFEQIFLSLESQVGDLPISEIEKTIKELKKEILFKKREQLAAEIARLEQLGKKKQLIDKEKDLIDLNNQLIALENP